MFCASEKIDEIKTKINIRKYIEKKVELMQNGDVYLGQCPFCKSTIKGLIVNENTQTYECFECGCSGDVIDFSMHYLNRSFGDTVCALALTNNISIDREVISEQYFTNQASIIGINLFAVNFYKKTLLESSKAMKYLKDRNLTEATIEKFDLGYVNPKRHIFNELKKQGYSNREIIASGLISIPDKANANEESLTLDGNYDKFYNRIVFPIINENDVIIGFGGRVLSDKKPKYINSQETIVYDKSCNLFGLNLAKQSKSDYFLLCEGYMDVIAMHQAGFDNAIASLGTALTVSQVHKLSKYKKNLILAYDTDEAGINAIKRAIPMLEQFKVGCKIINLEPYKDPDEFLKQMGKTKYMERIMGAEPADAWMVRNIILSKNIEYEKKLLQITKMLEK